MSDFHVEVVRIGKVEKHPNADSLSITHVYGEGGYPVIFRTEDFKEGDLAVYVPVDSIVDTTREQFRFLDGHPRVRAKRLRGVFSQGLLVSPEYGWKEGQDVAKELGVTRYEPPQEKQQRLYNSGGQPIKKSQKIPFAFPRYTDIENFRKHSNLFDDDENVVITEKAEGENFRAVYWLDSPPKLSWWKKAVNSVCSVFDISHPYKQEQPMKLWVGSHNTIRQWSEGCQFWNVALAAGLDESLKRHPGIVVFGEEYGGFKGFPYDTDEVNRKLLLFDAYDLRENRYLDFDDFLSLADDLGVPTAPILYRGAWRYADPVWLSEGKTQLGGGHIKEGVVIKPTKERWDHRVGRVILKLKSEAYLLSKHT